MLGRLARWLRLMGFDTVYRRDAADEWLVALAVAEGRWLVTRDTRLAALRRPGLRTVRVRANDFREQLGEVMKVLGRPAGRALSRCPACNGVPAPITAAQAAGAVPEYTLATQTEFRRCPGCGRVYWPGSHLDGIRRTLAEASP